MCISLDYNLPKQNTRCCSSRLCVVSLALEEVQDRKVGIGGRVKMVCNWEIPQDLADRVFDETVVWSMLGFANIKEVISQATNAVDEV